MNYRHIYHAGNHTEIFKHAVLVQLLDHLRKKSKPFFVLDTHAGLGLYDLTSEEALRTSEAEEGIGRVIHCQLPAATAYLEFVRSINPANELTCYPGSPAIVQAFLRSNDRLVACELHPQDVRQLREVFRHDRRVSIHHRDGYEAIGAFLPPAERRGILFIDPPYEKRSEFDELSQALIKACRRWPSGILAAWYPLKNRPVQIAFKDALRKAKIPECLSIELRLKPEDDFALVGGGMILINPPWQIEEAVRELGSEILQALDAMDGRTSIEWITPPN